MKRAVLCPVPAELSQFPPFAFEFSAGKAAQGEHYFSVAEPVGGIVIDREMPGSQRAVAACCLCLCLWGAAWLSFRAVRKAPCGAGEWVPYARLHRILADQHMRRACDLLEHIHPLSRAERVMLLRDNAPKWLRPFISRYRYLFLAAVINLPGNAVSGGGGGILSIAGLSRLFTTSAVALTLALAIVPVPLAVWAFGIDIMP